MENYPFYPFLSGALICVVYQAQHTQESQSMITCTVIDLFSALCAKLFQRGWQIFEVFFFLLSAHFNRLLYIEGNEFKG